MTNYALVQAGFGAPERQSRWKIAFRLILAIPLFIWYFVVCIAAVLLIIIGWFAALVLGRLPFAIARFLSNFVVFQARVYSYLYLMNDAYPPFSAKAPFSVNLDIPVSKVRRLAVLFRYFLLIPGILIYVVSSLGLEISSVFIWLIVLVKGEMPLSLFGAVSAVLRFQARFNAYAMMITGKYPGELFGEKPIPAIDSSVNPDGEAPADVMVQPASELDQTDVPVVADSITQPMTSTTPEDGVTLPSEPPAPTGLPMIFPSDQTSPDASEQPRTARMVLSRGSKNILVIFIILGVLGYAADIFVTARAVRNESSLSSLTGAYGVLPGEIAVAQAQQKKCTQSPNSCLQQYYRTLAQDFSTFQETVASISFPSSAQADVTQLLNDTAKFDGELSALSVAGTTITQAQVNALQSLGNRFDTAYSQVISDLAGGL